MNVKNICKTIFIIPVLVGSIVGFENNVWAKDSVTIYFDPNGADNSNWTRPYYVLNSGDTWDLADGVPNYWQRKNYTLTSWNTKVDGTGRKYEANEVLYSISDFVGDKIYLYAQWTPSYTKMHYDGNGADNGSIPDEIISVERGYLKENKFSKSGYTFAGWKIGDFTYNPGEKISAEEANGEFKPNVVKRFSPSWSDEGYSMTKSKYYAQGGDVFERKGRKYVICTWCSTKNSGEDSHVVAVFDYETGAIINQNQSKTDSTFYLGHCGGVTYNPDTDSFFIAFTRCDNSSKDWLEAKYEKAGVSLIELNYNLTVKRKNESDYIKLKNKNGGKLSSVTGVDYVNGKYYVKSPSNKIWIYDKNFNYISETNNIMNSVTGVSDNIVAAQGMAYNGKYFYGGCFYGKAINNFISLIKPNIKSDGTYALDTITPIKLNTGDVQKNLESRMELQDFSFVNGKMYILSSSWAGVGMNDSCVVSEYGGGDLPVTNVKAVWIENTAKVTGINLDREAWIDKAGGTISLQPSVLPINAKNKSVTWKSSNEDVATVNVSGKVTGVKQGVSDITATTKDGGKKATCKVRVHFDDVGKDSYFYTPIYWAADNGITSGVNGTNLFKPQNTVTRGQMIAFLYRLAGKPSTAGMKNKFKDITDKSTFYNPILWGGNKGIIYGYSDGTFRENTVCTRGQVVEFLWRMAGSPEPKSTNITFKDVKPTDTFYKSILWATEKNIVTGYTDDTFRVNENCTRGQTTAFLHRYKKTV